MSETTERLPVFPLNAVVFPGVSLPLHVFEGRYRSLVHDLLAVAEVEDRRFGVVAIREGFEVGQHGMASVHRVGCVVTLDDVRPYPDGRFDIEVTGRRRMRIQSLQSTRPYLVAEAVVEPAEPVGRAESSGVAEAAERTRSTFEEYRRRLSTLRGSEVLDAPLPDEPEALSYVLASVCLLTLAERQALLEAEDTLRRLLMLHHALCEEMRAMRAIASLPATEVARMRWSPN
ncbi:MAG TPA: LON peptidase substrate-binding domain-containing protein [Nocardioidaceae bacterium]|nr:LON peptidase substrate-binding domain-containing protein [Nocardioidaceae bacterium]